jgi:putative transposase
MSNRRSRTSSKYIYYALQLYFPGLSLRKTSQRLSQFIIDETLIKVGNNYVWLWVATEPTDKIILGICISIERTCL